MNVATICIAVLLACAIGPTAQAQPVSVTVAASAVAMPSTAALTVAGLSSFSVQSLVSNVEVLEATPVLTFKRTARDTVAAWRFTPTGVSQQRKVEFSFIAD